MILGMLLMAIGIVTAVAGQGAILWSIAAAAAMAGIVCIVLRSQARGKAKAAMAAVLSKYAPITPEKWASEADYWTNLQEENAQAQLSYREKVEELRQRREELNGKTIAEALLVPTRIYVKSILALLEKVDVKGISHITGGGFYENIPRSIPDGLCAKIDKSAVKVLPIFDLIAKWGNVPERDMFNTYNMGVGMSVVIPADQVETALEILKAHGDDAYVIGNIIKGEEKVILA